MIVSPGQAAGTPGTPFFTKNHICAGFCRHNSCRHPTGTGAYDQYISFDFFLLKNCLFFHFAPSLFLTNIAPLNPFYIQVAGNCPWEPATCLKRSNEKAEKA
jgi:hypothetical protein